MLTTLRRALGLLAASVTLAGGTLLALPASNAGPAPACDRAGLYVAKGRLEAAAGNRYLTVRLTNVGDGPCSVDVVTRSGFRDWSGQLVKGRFSRGTGEITLDPGERATTVVHWVDPGPVPAADCQQATARLVTLRLPELGITWRMPLRAEVCTAHDLRPDSKPLS